ncbi:MAG TPA: hypothetical protein VL574_08315 [Stellaceae bacterium]|jgi:hypothetical protein|nr:hypothetical protein [Stellaceae bacterium]
MAKTPAPSTANSVMAKGKAANLPQVAGRPRRRVGSPSGNILILCTLVVLGVVSFPAFLLFCFGMLPTGVAYIIDHHRRFALTFTVLAPNLTATAIFIIKLMVDGASVQMVMEMMSNPYVWCMLYMSAGFGWLVYRCMPLLVTAAKEYRLEMQRAGHEASMKTLREEWGEDIAPPEVPEIPAGRAAQGRPRPKG